MKRKLLLGSLSLVVAALVGGSLFAIVQPVQVLPRLALAPGFVLTDQNGERLTNEDLRGSLAVYTFSSTGCGVRCAWADAATRQLAARLDEVDTGGAPVRLVTIMVDPARDAPPLLATAALALGADGVTWRLAGGDAAAVRQVVGGGFEVFYDVAPDGAVLLEPAFVVVDGWGITRARNRPVGTAVDGIPDQVLDQLRLLGNEVRASTGVARLAYEAAHLFSCYAY